MRNLELARLAPLTLLLLSAPVLAPGAPDCHPIPTDCRDGSACDDGDPCTVNDRCQYGTCAGEPRRCDDENACNGHEVCSPHTGECLSGVPLSCDDNDWTTLDGCTARAGCVHRPCEVPVFIGYPPGASADHIAIEAYLNDLGLLSARRFVPYVGLSEADFAGACAVIYDCGGWDWSRYKAGHGEEIAQVMTAARDAGIPVYLLGDDIAQGGGSIVQDLTHLTENSCETSSLVQIVDEEHPVTGGPFGLVPDFSYPYDADCAAPAFGTDTVLATSGSDDPLRSLILSYQHTSGAYVVVHGTNLCGGGSEHAECSATGAWLTASERLFKNTLAYFLTGPPSATCDCDDGDPCNGIEFCHPTSGACVAGDPPDCDDADPCTRDGCDDGGCSHARIPECTPEVCSDGQDSDRDGATDCDDTDCGGVSPCGPARECDLAGVRRIGCGETVQATLFSGPPLEILPAGALRVRIESTPAHAVLLLAGDCVTGEVAGVTSPWGGALTYTLQGGVPYYVYTHDVFEYGTPVSVTLHCL